MKGWKIIVIEMNIISNSRYVWRRYDRQSWHSIDGHLIILRFSANNGDPCRCLGASNLVRGCATINTGIPCCDLAQGQLDRTVVVQGHHCSSAWPQTNSVSMPEYEHIEQFILIKIWCHSIFYTLFKCEFLKI